MLMNSTIDASILLIDFYGVDGVALVGPNKKPQGRDNQGKNDT